MTGVRLVLRRRRRSLLALALFAAAAGAGQGGLYRDLAGSTAAERAAFAAESQAMASQLTFVAPLPTDLGTLGGYLTWRVFGSLALVLAFWAVWFAVSVTRDDEADGLTEHLLAAGLGRWRVLGAASLAFLVAAAGVVGVMCLGIGLAPASRGELPVAGLALQGLALVALLAPVFAMGVLVAQVTAGARLAVAVAGVVVFVLNLVNAVGSSTPSLATVRQVSPFAWYSRSEPLATGGAFSVAGVGGSVALALGLMLVAGVCFRCRDLGEPLFVRRRAPRRVDAPQGGRWFSTPVLGPVYEHRRVLTAWLAGTLAMVGFFTTAVPALVASLHEIESLRPYLAALAADDVERGIVGLFLLGTLQLLLAAVALSFVALWAREDRGGRLELELASSVSRTQVVVRRAAFLTVVGLGLSAAAMTLLVAVARLRRLDIGVAGAARTVVALVVFTLAFAGVGALLTARWPRSAILGLGIFTASSYFLNEVAPLYAWPDRVRDLSVFHLVGNPLAQPLDVPSLAALALTAGAAFVAAAVLMRRRDVGA